MDRSIHEDFEMVDSSALPFDLQASPSTLFLQSTEHSAIHDDRPLTAPISSTSGKRHQYSSAQWEELKPLIRRLYLDENRTFTDVATTLRDTHGFFPTYALLYCSCAFLELCQLCVADPVTVNGNFRGELTLGDLRRTPSWTREDQYFRALNLARIKSCFTTQACTSAKPSWAAGGRKSNYEIFQSHLARR